MSKHIKDLEIPETLLETPDANMLNLETTEWEDIMIADLASKLQISENIVLEIMSNILANEVQAKCNDVPCLLSNIEKYFIHKAIQNHKER